MENIQYNQIFDNLLELKKSVKNRKNCYFSIDSLYDIKKNIYKWYYNNNVDSKDNDLYLESLLNQCHEIELAFKNAKKYPAIKKSRSNISYKKRLAFGIYYNLTAKITPSIKAVMRVIEIETIKHGICTLSVKEIGDIAGIARSTVQYALRFLRSHHFIDVTERPIKNAPNLTNIISIIKIEWINAINSPSIRDELKSQYFNLSKIKDRGLKKIGSILDHLYINKAYYREVMNFLTLKNVKTNNYGNKCFRTL